MPDPRKHFTLSARQAQQGADPLLAFLTGAQGHPICLDVSNVSSLDTQRFQLLAVARLEWLAQGLSMTVTGISAPFKEGLERLGVGAQFFDMEGNT